jgi:alkanesulfonate monooxygenase SsuD/methylene tetrahydromethanopterin reductase-like flavin-dependent oxidoreductase (luciferase family)
MGMNISVELSHACPLTQIPAHAAAIESKGFHRAWVPDTLVSQWEAWLAASLMVTHTTSLNIGMGVTNPYTHHPMAMAQMAATLQTLSSGRLSLSIGKGIPRLLEKAGINTHASAVEECITILRELVAGKKVNFNGEFFHIDGIRLRTLPPKEKIPIYLAAIGPESWESAMRTADGVATIWSEQTADIKGNVMAERQLPVAVLVPFSVSKEAFFPQKAETLDELMETVRAIEKERFDEVIIAYRDMRDLELAEGVVRAFSD